MKEGIWRAAVQWLVPLGAKAFLAFLDLSLLPRPELPAAGHSAGEQHQPADFTCRCWDHRCCVDFLTQTDRESTKGLAQVLMMLAVFVREGVDLEPTYMPDERTYFGVTISGMIRYIAIVWPFGRDSGEVERYLAFERARVANTGYLVLGTRHRARELLTKTNAARPVPSTGVNAARPGQFRLRAVYQEDLDGVSAPTVLVQRLEQLFAAA